MSRIIATAAIRGAHTLVERAEEMGEYLAGQMAGIASRHEILAHVRGRGLMVGVDVLSPERGAVDPMLSLALEAECLLLGLVVGYSAQSGVLRILPPLTITEEEIDRAMEVLDQAVSHIEERGVDLARYMPTHAGSLKLAGAFLGKLGGG